MNPRTACALLEVRGTASIEDIQRAYKRLALKFHPDKNLPEHTQCTTEAFQLIQGAKQVLLDRRVRTTKSGRPRSQRKAGPDFCWGGGALLAVTGAGALGEAVERRARERRQEYESKEALLATATPEGPNRE
eukprot:g20567.t1